LVAAAGPRGQLDVVQALNEELSKADIAKRRSKARKIMGHHVVACLSKPEIA
jgi:hypothetical protein